MRLLFAAFVVLCAAATVFAQINVDGGYCGILGIDGAPTAWPIPDPPTNFRLLHGTVNIRHGDRVTTQWSFPCWDNDQGVWQCSLDNLELPSTTASDSGKFGRLYRKTYLPNRNMFPGDCAQGELTSLGYKQHLANGQALYDFFVTKTGLLGPRLSYNRDRMWLRGDDEPRVLQSGQALILGMFPPDNSEGLTDLVEFNTMDRQLDDMTPNGNLCPKFNQYMDELVKSPAYVAHFNNVTLPLMQQVAQVVGQSQAWAQTASPVNTFDCLNSHLCHAMPIPSGFTQSLYDRVVAEATWNWQQQFSYPSVTENARVGIGYLLEEIFNGLANFDSDSSPLFSLYSGHDDTLIPVLNALGLWDQFYNKTWVPYASLLTFELYEYDPNPVERNQKQQQQHREEKKLDRASVLARVVEKSRAYISKMRSRRIQDRKANNARFLRITFNGQILVLPGCSELCNMTYVYNYVSNLFPLESGNCDTTDGKRRPFLMDHKGARHNVNFGQHKLDL